MAELERAVKQLVMRGIELCINVNGEELAADKAAILGGNAARLLKLGRSVRRKPRARADRQG
jgi:hypothetical protein